MDRKRDVNKKGIRLGWVFITPAIFVYVLKEDDE